MLAGEYHPAVTELFIGFPESPKLNPEWLAMLTFDVLPTYGIQWVAPLKYHLKDMMNILSSLRF